MNELYSKLTSKFDQFYVCKPSFDGMLQITNIYIPVFYASHNINTKLHTLHLFYLWDLEVYVHTYICGKFDEHSQISVNMAHSTRLATILTTNFTLSTYFTYGICKFIHIPLFVASLMSIVKFLFIWHSLQD